MAFVGPDLEEEFQATKKQQIDKELGIDDKKLQALSQGERNDAHSIQLPCSQSTFADDEETKHHLSIEIN